MNAENTAELMRAGPAEPQHRAPGKVKLGAGDRPCHRSVTMLSGMGSKLPLLLWVAIRSPSREMEGRAALTREGAGEE